METKEIIILTTTLGGNGAERILTELSNEWVRSGNRVIVMQIGVDDNSSSYILDERVERINVRAKRKNRVLWYIKEVQAVIKTLNDHKNATALAFLSQSFYILSIASFFTKNKIVFSERNDPTRWPKKWIHRKARDMAFCKADVCVFQTKEAMSYFPKKARDKGIVIPNPCNPNLPERFIGERRKVIITASRLHNQKNLPMLIKAFYSFHKEFPEYRLEIYGEGEERHNLESLVDSLGLGESVALPGFAKNIHEIMVDCAMYICSSDYEGISNSMLEALGMGVPTISTDCPVGGAREMIQSGMNGLLVPVGDDESLFMAMKRIAEDQSFADMLSENACRIKADYTIQAIANKWLEAMN